MDFKKAYERLKSRLKEELDFFEGAVENGGVSAAVFHKIITKVLTDEEKTMSSLLSSATNSVDEKFLVIKKEEKEMRTLKNKKDVEIVNLDSEEEENDVQTRLNSSIKRRLNNDDDDDQMDKMNKRVKSTQTDLIRSVNVEHNLNDQEEHQESTISPASTSFEQSSMSLLPSSSSMSTSPISSFSYHHDNDNFEGSQNENNELQNMSFVHQDDGEEEEEETNSNLDTITNVIPFDEQSHDIFSEEQEPSTSRNSYSDIEIETVDEEQNYHQNYKSSDDGARRDSDDACQMHPISCPKVNLSFWFMTATEKQNGVQKYAIHNYPRKLGKEHDPEYRLRFGTDLWFLVSVADKEFIYYTLEDLTAELNSIRKPKLWLQLQLSDFHDEQLDSFLTTFGKFVTHFTFERRLQNYEHVTEQELTGLLFGKLYNLEYLVLDEDYITTSPSDSLLNATSSNQQQQKQQQLLSQLKIIQFINSKFNFSTDFIETILKSSPKLKLIHNLPLKFVNFIISLGKIHQVKSVEMDRSDSYTSKALYAKDLMTLAKSKIALEKLVIPAYFNEPNGHQTVISMSYRRFFKSSQNSLRELYIEPVKAIDWSQLGTLDNLKTLHINIYGFPSHYSNELDINKTFPKVKILILDYWTEKTCSLSPEKFFEKYFPKKVFIPGKSFKTVVELRLRNSFPAKCMVQMSDLLPKISTLCWNCTLSKFREVLPFCWSLWLRMETLIFQIDLSTRIDNEFEYADSGLLGLPEEICEQLRNGNQIENVEDFEKKPSILDLKNLKRFEIEVQEPSCPSDETPETRIFSKIAASHGFAKVKERNPKFTVLVTFHSSCTTEYVQNVRRNFKPFLPFVVEF